MRTRLFRSYCGRGGEFFVHAQLQSPILAADLMQQHLDELAIRLCAQDVHHRLVARCETKFKTAPFDSKNVGCRSRVSDEGFLCWNPGKNSLPNFFGIDGCSFFFDAGFTVAGGDDPGFLCDRFRLAAVGARGYRSRRRRTRLARRSLSESGRSRPTVTELPQFLDHLIERRLSETLDCFDDSNFEMELLVRCPFHSPL